MGTPVTDIVHFNVTASTSQAEDHWVAITIETGLVAFGKTEDDARDEVAKANLMLVRSWKRRGANALAGFMQKHGITYHVVNDGPADEQLAAPMGKLPLAA